MLRTYGCVCHSCCNISLRVLTSSGYYSASEPAAEGHHTTSLQGVWYTRAYKRVPALEDLRNHIDFSRPGPIYVVTRGSRVGFFPSS